MVALGDQGSAAPEPLRGRACTLARSATNVSGTASQRHPEGRRPVQTAHGRRRSAGALALIV